MIWALLFLFIKKYGRHFAEYWRNNWTISADVLKGVILFLPFLWTVIPASAQDKTLQYEIKRKDDIVGNIELTQQSISGKTVFRLESDVKTKLLFVFIARGEEESVFENSVMTTSRLYRELNGKEKANKLTTLQGTAYHVRSRRQTTILNYYPIRYNLLCMYTIEPVNISKVYSDNFQQFCFIQRLGGSQYKVCFPDGNYNEYFYRNGICSRIEIHHTLYSATIKLKMATGESEETSNTGATFFNTYSVNANKTH